MTSPKLSPVSRSERFILVFQLSGLCRSLHVMAKTKQPQSPYVFTMLQKLHADATKNVSGPAVASLPTLPSTASLHETLILAEVLYSTMLAFLTPEEMQETRQTCSRPEYDL